MNKAIGDLLTGDDCVLERAPLTTALASRASSRPANTRGFWQCMDNIREMAILNELWASGKAPWKTW